MTTYRLELPRYDTEPQPRLVWSTLRGNSRPGHWSKRHRAVRRLITDVTWLAKAAKVPAGRHVTVRLTWAPGRRVRADADNLWPLLKTACDALARGRKDLPGLHLVPDDTPEYMTKHAPAIAYPPAEPGLWLDVEVTP